MYGTRFNTNTFEVSMPVQNFTFNWQKNSGILFYWIITRIYLFILLHFFVFFFLVRKLSQDESSKNSKWSELRDCHIHICSRNNFPTAAGLASSAAGYSCLGMSRYLYVDLFFLLLNAKTGNKFDIHLSKENNLEKHPSNFSHLPRGFVEIWSMQLVWVEGPTFWKNFSFITSA